jgi:hypothetical protein
MARSNVSDGEGNSTFLPPPPITPEHGRPLSMVAKWICDLLPWQASSPTGASPRTLLQHHHFISMRILLADSNTVSAEVTRKLLERLDCEMVPVSSLSTA